MQHALCVWHGVCAQFIPRIVPPNARSATQLTRRNFDWIWLCGAIHYFRCILEGVWGLAGWQHCPNCTLERGRNLASDCPANQSEASVPEHRGQASVGGRCPVQPAVRYAYAPAYVGCSVQYLAPGSICVETTIIPSVCQMSSLLPAE